MQLFHPTSPHHFAMRHELLQSSLRPEPLPFPIEQEYPIVLDQSRQQYSYCFSNDQKIIAHFNLWPRQLRSIESTWRIGLVGNVATSEEQRGRGIMSQCFQFLDQISTEQKLDAIVLWSDLHSFYQKLGFVALGDELRFLFNTKYENTAAHFLPCNTDDLSASDLKSLFSLRYPVAATLDRSAEEFRQLLRIPSMELFTHKNSGKIVGFGIVGKGYDMAGVVHEWGVQNKTDIAKMVNDIGAACKYPEVMLLSPACLQNDWLEDLNSQALSCEKHHMALIKTKNSDLSRCFEQSFIWGLDSI